VPNDVPDWTFQTQALSGGVLTKLAEVAGNGVATTLSFTSISTTAYRKLIVEAWLGIGNGAQHGDLTMQLNTDTAANYDWVRTRSNGGGVATDSNSGATSATVGEAGGDVANALSYALIEIGEANVSSQFKPFLFRGTWILTSFGNNNLQELRGSGIWHQAGGAAISQIDLIGVLAFTTSSLAILYGLQ
jgi:hypothetical protein